MLTKNWLSFANSDSLHDTRRTDGHSYVWMCSFLIGPVNGLLIL